MMIFLMSVSSADPHSMYSAHVRENKWILPTRTSQHTQLPCTKPSAKRSFFLFTSTSLCPEKHIKITDSLFRFDLTPSLDRIGMHGGRGRFGLLILQYKYMCKYMTRSKLNQAAYSFLFCEYGELYSWSVAIWYLI